MLPAGAFRRLPWGFASIAMKLALLSDLHANRQAFDACLAHARAQGAERFALLGDLVGYGAEPRYVVQQAMVLAAQGAVLVQGNHDAQAADPPAVSAAAQQAPCTERNGPKSIVQLGHHVPAYAGCWNLFLPVLVPGHF